MKRTSLSLIIAIAALSIGGIASSSSHKEAPLITKTPKVDGTDLYMFRSYEPGREGYVTFLANYIPVQDPAGGPNFYTMDEDALYAIHIDNDGDAEPDLSFLFRFENTYLNKTVPVNGVPVAVPIVNVGPFGATPDDVANRNLIEAYHVYTTRNQNGHVTPATNVRTGGRHFVKPSDNIGTKSIPTYETYANGHISDMSFQGCNSDARVFVGQRREGFAVALGEIFDLINLNPLGPPDGEPNDLAFKNVTSIALEVPISCLTQGDSPIIGAWTTARGRLSASTRGGPKLGRSGAQFFRRTQLSRLSAPLVNEIVIGLKDKDRFNASHPVNDEQFALYVTNPTLPELIEILFPAVQAPNLFPRTDLVAAFLTGIDGLNKPANVVPAEMMRLNTSIAPKAAGAQMNLGVLAGDTAGFPNGRRPGDDVVDIELRVAMGVLLSAEDAPSGQLPYTDGATVQATDFQETFPYLNTPLPGDFDN